MEDPKYKIHINNEILRKGIHLFSSVIPIFYLFNDRDITAFLLFIAALLMVLIDLGRKVSKSFDNFYLFCLRSVLRNEEFNPSKHLFTGGTLLVLSAFATVVIFPKEIAVTALFVMIICDTSAAITGKITGRIKIWNKTLEGSLAFFLSGIILIIILPKMTSSINEYFVAVSALLLTTVMELMPIKIDDNIINPIFFATCYTSLIFIFNIN